MEVDIVREPNMIIEKFYQCFCHPYYHYWRYNKLNCYIEINTDISEVLIFNDDLANINLLARMFSR